MEKGESRSKKVGGGWGRRMGIGMGMGNINVDAPVDKTTRS